MTATEVRKLQMELNKDGARLTVDGIYGPKTKAAHQAWLEKNEAPKPKRRGAFWMATIDKLMGKRETDKELQGLLVPFWKKLFGLSIKTLVGASAAWCGLTVGYVYYVNGFKVPGRGAAAKTWGTDAAGVRINWKVDGIPRGASLHIDHQCDCQGGGNHTGFAKGDCAPQDLMSGSITIRGGNQGDKVKDSNFKVCEICSAHWADPDPNNPPPKITKSNGCSTGNYVPETTR